LFLQDEVIGLILNVKSNGPNLEDSTLERPHFQSGNLGDWTWLYLPGLALCHWDTHLTMSGLQWHCVITWLII